MNKKEVSQVEDWVALAVDVTQNLNKLVEDVKDTPVINTYIGEVYQRLKSLEGELAFGISLASLKLSLDCLINYKEE